MKVSKKSVDFEWLAAKDHYCSDCIYWQVAICQRVKGPLLPWSWCKLWKRDKDKIVRYT